MFRKRLTVALAMLSAACVLQGAAAVPRQRVAREGERDAQAVQHEVLHGHPTGSKLLNEAMIFPTPTFWLPYLRYRQTHLQHHNDQHLTDPRLDPESYYLLPEDWAHVQGIRRALYEANNTLAGRMLIGPAISIIRFWSSEARDGVRPSARSTSASML